MKLSMISNYLQGLRIVLCCDPERKSLFLILFEYIWYSLTNRTIANQYFTKYFYRKGASNYKEHVLSDSNLKKVWDSFNNPDFKQILENKYIFYHYMSKHNINISKVLATIYTRSVTWNNEMYYLDSLDSFETIMKEIIAKESSSGSLFIKKSNLTSGGDNIYKISMETLTGNKNKRLDVFNKLIQSSYIIQDTIIQHPVMNSICSSSVNTIRINTFIDLNHKAEVLAAMARFGIGNSYVDNVSSGGICVGIDEETCRLKSQALTTITQGKALEFKQHPVSGIIFKNLEIPFYKEARELVIKAACIVPELRLVGWDVAITEKGPVIIEGNDQSGIHHVEMANGGFRHNPVFIKLFREIDPTFGR